MSLLAPVRVPVKVYRWDDVDAPTLDKTAGCMMTIFKACLVTGYGTKEGAGWTMPFEDTAAGVKVLRPEVGPHTDFYLKCSEDTGTTMKAQVMINATSANDGDEVARLETLFRYNFNQVNRWVLIASPRALWFFANIGNAYSKRGVYFYCGDVPSSADGQRAIYIRHTAGIWSAGIGSRKGFFDNEQIGYGSSYGLLYNAATQQTVTATPSSWFRGSQNLTGDSVLTRAGVVAAGNLWLLPAYGVSNNAMRNFDVQESAHGSLINHSTNIDLDESFCVPIDYWDY